MFIDEVPYHLQVIVDGSIVYRGVHPRESLQLVSHLYFVIRSMTISTQPWAAARWSRDSLRFVHWSLTIIVLSQWVHFYQSIVNIAQCGLCHFDKQCEVVYHHYCL